jgi:hypothetical protein
MGIAASIVSAIGGVSASLEILNKLLSAHTSKEVADAVSDVQSKLITAHTVALALQEQVAEQAEEIRKLRETAAEKARYQLVEIIPGRGVFAYFYDGTPFKRAPRKPAVSEPPHYICQRCFNKGIKSVLQATSGRHGNLWHCTECGRYLPLGEWPRHTVEP